MVGGGYWEGRRVVCVKLGGAVHDMKDLDDICEELCRVLYEDVINGGLRDWWWWGGDGSWNISVARSFRRYGWVTMDRSISVA